MRICTTRTVGRVPTRTTRRIQASKIAKKGRCYRWLRRVVVWGEQRAPVCIFHTRWRRRRSGEEVGYSQVGVMKQREGDVELVQRQYIGLGRLQLSTTPLAVQSKTAAHKKKRRMWTAKKKCSALFFAENSEIDQKMCGDREFSGV